MPTNTPPKPERAGETGDAGFFIPANNPIETDHGRLKSRLRAMRGLKQLRCARVITAGHAFIQNIRRGHYKLGTEQTANLRVPAAFDELVMAI
jgi:transposase, IS6 family